MEKYAKDIQVGDKFQPWISERTMKRIKKQYTATGLPQYETGAFSHYVLIPCTNSKGEPDEVFIFCEDFVTVVE